MGKQIDSGMLTFKVTEKNLSKILKLEFIEDSDFNGDNGEEYLSEEAEDQGFESDQDMAFDRAEKETANLTGEKKVRKFIDILIEELKGHGGDYYRKIEYNVIPCGKNFTVSVLYETAW